MLLLAGLGLQLWGADHHRRRYLCRRRHGSRIPTPTTRSGLLVVASVLTAITVCPSWRSCDAPFVGKLGGRLPSGGCPRHRKKNARRAPRPRAIDEARASARTARATGFHRVGIASGSHRLVGSPTPEACGSHCMPRTRTSTYGSRRAQRTWPGNRRILGAGCCRAALGGRGDRQFPAGNCTNFGVPLSIALTGNVCCGEGCSLFLPAIGGAVAYASSSARKPVAER